MTTENINKKDIDANSKNGQSPPPIGVLVNSMLVRKSGPGESGHNKGERIEVVYQAGRNPI